VAAVGIVFATLGALAAINFKDVGGRSFGGTSTVMARDHWAEFGINSLYYRFQLWSFRVFGGFVAVAGIAMFVMACV